MNQDLSQLGLTELYDKLSEYTTTYSKSMITGVPESEFSRLRSLIEEIQKEISSRKSGPIQADAPATGPTSSIAGQ